MPEKKEDISLRDREGVPLESRKVFLSTLSGWGGGTGSRRTKGFNKGSWLNRTRVALQGVPKNSGSAWIALWEGGGWRRGGRDRSQPFKKRKGVREPEETV